MFTDVLDEEGDFLTELLECVESCPANDSLEISLQTSHLELSLLSLEEAVPPPTEEQSEVHSCRSFFIIEDGLHWGTHDLVFPSVFNACHECSFCKRFTEEEFNQKGPHGFKIKRAKTLLSVDLSQEWDGFFSELYREITPPTKKKKKKRGNFGTQDNHLYSPIRRNETLEDDEYIYTDFEPTDLRDQFPNLVDFGGTLTRSHSEPTAILAL